MNMTNTITDNTESNDAKKQNFAKITVVGDGVVGKTCLLISYTKHEFPIEYVPTVFENYIQEIEVDNEVYNMTLWDTAGQEDYERLRPLSYPGTNCFLICYSVDSSLASYDNVISKWVPEIRHHSPNTPIVLVATKCDLREDPSVQCYSIKDGKKLQKRVKAQGIVECSAKEQIGLDEVFEEAIHVYKRSKMKKRKPRNANQNCSIL